MYVQELIDRLSSCGDAKYRQNAKVRILDCNGKLIDDDIEVFDVKDGLGTIDIGTIFVIKSWYY